MAEQDRALVDMVIAADVGTVWSALRDPEQVQRWFGWDHPGLTAEIREIFVDQAQADIDPQADANPQDDPPADGTDAGQGAEAGSDSAQRTGTHTLSWPDGDRFVVEPRDDGGTRLQVTRRDHTGAAAFDGVYDPIDEGWITFAQQLRFALERHPGQDRRTVSIDDADLGPEDDPLLRRLGLRPLGDDPVGGAYSVERPDGTRFSGEVFFQTDLQVGLVVAEERDALLVVARRPPASAPPHGQVTFVLSTYGFDDAQYAELESRWTEWWSPGEGS